MYNSNKIFFKDLKAIKILNLAKKLTHHRILLINFIKTSPFELTQKSIGIFKQIEVAYLIMENIF